MTQTAVAQFNPDQLKLVRETVAKGTTEAEFKLFIEVCKYHRLNPFARQIYAVVREGYQGRQLTIQTSIDGYRLLAERSGKYAGQVGPQWCDSDGVWLDVWLKDTPPAAARVGVIRTDFRQEIWGVAKFKSYAQTKKDGVPTTMWLKMPDVMLAKCAESLALRKAFPAEMSGIYTKEEMDQADDDLPTVAVNEHTVESDPPPQNTVDPEHPKPGQDISNAPATEQQIASMHKLYDHLAQPVPEDVVGMTYIAAKARIQKLTAEYRTVKQNGTVPAPGTSYLKPSEVETIKTEWMRVRGITGEEKDFDAKWGSFRRYLSNATTPLAEDRFTVEHKAKAETFFAKQQQPA